MPLELSQCGYYESPDQADGQPTFDPGIDGVNCPVCDRPLVEAPRCTVSFMGWEPRGERSYFFRAHRDCYKPLSLEQQVAYEGAIIDLLRRGVN